MAKGINKVILVGNLGSDPEARSGATRISVATTEVWKDKQTGDKQERTEWHRVVAFGKLGEIMSKYLRKGSKVYIEGSLRTSSYDKDGVKMYTTDVIASEMQMLDSKGASGGGSQGEPDFV